MSKAKGLQDSFLPYKWGICEKSKGFIIQFVTLLSKNRNTVSVKTLYVGYCKFLVSSTFVACLNTILYEKAIFIMS